MRVATFACDPSPGAYSDNLDQAVDGLERAAAEGARLLALPELWPTSFMPAGDPRPVEASAASVERLAVRAAELGVVVVGSGLAPSGSGRPFNRAHVLEGGAVRATHDKVHLFSPTGEPMAFTAGKGAPPVVETAAGKLSPLVCYDLRFPEVARAAFRQGAELLVVVAQWPATRAEHWRGLCLGRAVEGQWNLVAANRSGSEPLGSRGHTLEFSGNGLVVSPSGELLGEGDARDPLLVVDVDPGQPAKLRRAVPVRRDERRDVYTAWAGEPGGEK